MEECERKAVTSKSEGTLASTSTTQSKPEYQTEKDITAADADADKIDVCSDKFDPLLALYSPTVSIPFPKIKCFNNVSEYESFLKGGRGRAKPENVEKKRLKAKKGVADPERIERLKKLMVNNPVTEAEGGESSCTSRRRRQKPQKNVLTRMPCMFNQSHCYYITLYTNNCTRVTFDCHGGDCGPIGGAVVPLSPVQNINHAIK